MAQSGPRHGGGAKVMPQRVRATLLSMKTLRESLADVTQRRVALAHFNVANLDMLHAVVRAADAVGEPVIVGVSEGERDAIGIKELVVLMKEMQLGVDVPLFLNADHTYSVERVKEAIDAGFDAVIYDGAKLPIEENIANTKECVDYARASGRDVLVEAELGFIGSGSQVFDAVPDGAIITSEMMTTVEEAVRFVTETGVDLFAPAVGNVHGIINGPKGGADVLNIERIQAISEATGKPLVLHGGSGVSDEDFTAAIKAGIRIVHISTELRRAYRQGLEHDMAGSPKELAPYKYMDEAATGVQALAEGRMRLFVGIK